MGPFNPLLETQYENVIQTDLLIGPRIFFSRSPLTFGHSIVIIPKPISIEYVSEDTFFHWSAPFIEYAINKIYQKFGIEEIYKSITYQNISEKTSTNGNYIKTINSKSKCK